MTVPPSSDSDALVDSWRDPKAPPLSKHLKLEIANAIWVGHRPGEDPPLDATDPVPGCPCAACRTLAAGGTWTDVPIVEIVVDDLASLPPAQRSSAAEVAQTDWQDLGVQLPTPGVLVQLARVAPGAVREDPRRGTKIPDRVIERARRADILEVTRQLGLGEPVQRGREVAVTCPLHDDHHPSLRLDSSRGLWYCDPCGIGGDCIELWRLVRTASFADAVAALAESVTT